MTALARPIVFLLALLVVVPGVPAVHARPGKAPLTDKQKEQRGREHFSRGKHLADAGRYVEALVELTKGYELTGRPLFLFNMAEAARAMDDVAQARELYEKYLAAEADGPFANAARARIVELTPKPEPAASAEPAPTRVVIPAPRDAAAAADQRRAFEPSARAPERAESHTVRNVLIVSIGLAVVGGAIAAYVLTREPACGPGCVDLR